MPLQFGGQELKPSAYGAGLVSGYFVVSDLGAHDILAGSGHSQYGMRPVPLQMTAGPTGGTYRLYRGRDYVEFRRAK